MQTFLVQGAEPSKVDGVIVRALQSAALEPPGGETVVGFRNERGAIYRKAVVHGLLQMLTLTYRMEELGFEDELSGQPRYAGFDAIFGTGRPGFQDRTIPQALS